MKRVQIMNLYQLSNTAFAHLVDIGVVNVDLAGEYTSPWDEEQLFKSRDVASFLTRVSRKYWSVRQVTSQFENLFFDLHQGKCERKLLRITAHDFRSLVISVDTELTALFDKHFVGVKLVK